MTATATSTATATPTVVVPSVGIADAPAVLEGGVSTFTVTLSQATTRSVSVGYATASGSATGGGIDFTSASGSVTIPAGSTTGTISVQTIDDLLFEPTEQFAVNLSAPTNGTLGRAQATGSILSDDAEVTISVADAAQVTEGGSLTFLVSLSRPAPGPDGVAVTFATADGTASAPADYAAQAGTLAFIPGQQQRQIVVVTTGDSLNEAAEIVLVNLTNPVGASIADGQGTGTIADDDGPVIRIVESARASEPLLPSTGMASFDVFLSFASAGTVTVQYAAQDSTGPENATGGSSCAAADYIAISGATLTFSPGQTTRTIAVTICGDVEEEPEETYNVVLSAPTGATLGSSLSTGFIRDTPQNP